MFLSQPSSFFLPPCRWFAFYGYLHFWAINAQFFFICKFLLHSVFVRIVTIILIKFDFLQLTQRRYLIHINVRILSNSPIINRRTAILLRIDPKPWRRSSIFPIMMMLRLITGLLLFDFKTGDQELRLTLIHGASLISTSQSTYSLTCEINVIFMHVVIRGVTIKNFIKFILIVFILYTTFNRFVITSLEEANAAIL